MTVDSKLIHDSLYAPNGGHVPKEGGSCSILLKKKIYQRGFLPGRAF